MLCNTEEISLKRHQGRFELHQEGEKSSLLQANPTKKSVREMPTKQYAN